MTRFNPTTLIAVRDVEETIVRYEPDIEQRHAFRNAIPISDCKTVYFSIFIFPTSYSFTHVGF